MSCVSVCTRIVVCLSTVWRVIDNCIFDTDCNGNNKLHTGYENDVQGDCYRSGPDLVCVEISADLEVARTGKANFMFYYK